MRIRLYAMLTAIGLLLAHASSTSAQNKDNSFKNRFQIIEVSTFEAPTETKFPAENLKPMMDEIVLKLIGLKKFKEVVRPGETATDAAAPTVQLVGAVTKYEPGSRAKRYVISMGAGKTRIVTHIKFVDKATGQVLLESDASGAVSWGLFGGSSKSSLTGVGKKVAEITKRSFF